MAVIVHSCVMLFVVTLCVAASMKNAEECPADMKKRGEICCKPVTCEINEDYQLCNDTHREDKCIRCPPNTTNQDIINTSHLDVQILGICQKIDCNPETRCPPGARITNPDECSETGIAICECDLYKGFCDKDPGTCQIWGGNVTDLTEGVGLTQRCLAEKCKPGYFKDHDGYGPCLKHRDCSEGEMIIFNGNSTMDRQCGPLTEIQTKTPTESTKMFDANSTVENSSTPTSPSNDGTTDPDQIIIGVVVGCIILIVVIIVFVVIYRHRRGRNNANPGDEEQNRGLSPNGQEAEPPLQNEREGGEPLTGGRGMVDRACKFTMRLSRLQKV